MSRGNEPAYPVPLNPGEGASGIGKFDGMTLRDRCEALPEAAKHFAKSFLMLLAAAITPWAVIGTCVWLFGTKNAIVPILLSMCAIGAGVMTATRVKL